MKASHQHRNSVRVQDKSIANTFMLMSFGAAFLLLLSAGRKPDSTVAVNPNPPLDAESGTVVLTSSSAPNPLAKTFRLVVDLSDRQLNLYQKGKLISTHDVAIGQAGWETPTGTFEVTTMEKNPAWEHPITGEIIPSGPDNPLGSRWIGFTETPDGYIGFHGTNEPQFLGQAVSHGCVRVDDTEIQEIYDRVGEGTPVIIRS
ncbi:L,D-transpeptidase [Microcoleus sp. FACHB-1515]|uniref:L,D-transpeptidase n=1 Tax=Cyanophyceae TaxID=3028117 RepID=UPI001F556AA3|nr:L,D-transpeptidase [Microcoleus sp. FACHB-1515]